MKRWHHKSRNGCLQCRQRRIKCDEGRPACRNCTRAEAPDNCVYRQVTAPTGSAQASKNGQPSAPLATALGSPLPLTHRELELMHHFCTSTSQALEDEANVSSWTRDVAPTLLLPHSNLIGGLFGLAAVHKAYLRPYDKQQYVTLAYRHLNHALVQSQQLLQNLSKAPLTPEYAGALCLTAIYTSVTIRALPVVDSNQNHINSIQRFITNLQAFRGISVVFWACSIHGRAFDQSFLPPNGLGFQALCDEESLRILNDIYMVIQANAERVQCEQGQQKHALYCAVFDELRNHIRAKTTRQIFTVITGSTPTQWNMFCKLLQEGDVICSLIGLCYNVSYVCYDRRWYMGGLQSEVASILAARVEHAGPLEAKIAAWARRRIASCDAEADRVPSSSGPESRPHRASFEGHVDTALVTAPRSSSSTGMIIEEQAPGAASWDGNIPAGQASIGNALDLSGSQASQ